MNYLIHGATNGSNFGDCLFAHIFYEYLLKNEKDSVAFYKAPRYGIGQFLINELNYSDNGQNLKNSDSLVYMSGGYFGDTDGNIRETIVRYIRYFYIGDYFIKKKRPIYICGIGGGPIHNKWLLKKLVGIMNNASAITVRDEETANFFLTHGVVKNVIVTSDTALLLKYMKIPTLDNFVNDKIEQIAKNRKIIFVHVYGADKFNVEIEEKIIPALNIFFSKHPDEYICIVGTDNKSKTKVENLTVFKKIHCDKIAYDFYDTMQMCAILKKIDIAITVKLHVGIVASVFGKCVISVAKHKNKTKRFYKQIGESDRCRQLSEVDSSDIEELMEKFCKKKVSIPLELFERAKKNLDILR